MLYYLSQLPNQLSAEMADFLSWLRVFQYVTLRSVGGAATAFILSLLLGPRLIRFLRRKSFGQNVRDDDVLAHHRHKQGTPTMGGVLIIGTTCIACLLWVNPGSVPVLITICTMIFMGAIGFYDDFLKIAKKQSGGLNKRGKLILQSAWMMLVWLVLREYMVIDADAALKAGFSPDAIVDGKVLVLNALYVPFLKAPLIADMGYFTIIFMFVVLVGCTNAVNLTDGMDGLAIGCMNSATVAYMVMAYAVGHAEFADYLQIPNINGTSELTVFCGSLIGAGAGFLWFNCHPARIFMGDTGSLALGGALAMVAILTKQEVVLIIVGGVFFMEAMSVMLQVGSYKLRNKKRIFRCAPIHHHFEIVTKERAEREGLTQDAIENQVVVRFWILGMLFAVIGLATLKLR